MTRWRVLSFLSVFLSSKKKIAIKQRALLTPGHTWYFPPTHLSLFLLFNSISAWIQINLKCTKKVIHFFFWEKATRHDIKKSFLFMPKKEEEKFPSKKSNAIIWQKSLYKLLHVLLGNQQEMPLITFGQHAKNGLRKKAMMLQTCCDKRGHFALY